MNVQEGESPNVINITLSGQRERYSGMGGSSQPAKAGSGTTLDQAVTSTILRDLRAIYSKTLCVFSANGQTEKLDELRRNWDLWGPLLISLGITAFVCMGSYGDTEELFTNLFVVLWLGPLIISLNCRLLGARISLIQSVSLIIYCTAPILLLSLVVFIVRLVYHSFIVNLALSAVAVGFTLRGAQFYFRSLVGQDKKYLVLYPIMLFYVFLATYISMT